MKESLSLLISFVLEYMIMVYYTNSTLSPKKGYAWANLGILSGYAILYIISLCYVPIANAVAFTAVNFAVIYMLFSIRLKNAVIQSIILTVIMMLSEEAVALIMHIGAYSGALLDVSLSARIIHSVLSKMIYFICIVAANHISGFFSKEKTVHGTVGVNIGLIFIPIFTIITLVGIMSVVEYISELQRLMFVGIAFFGFIANIIIYLMYGKMLMYYSELNELQEEKFKNNLELNYCNMLEDKLSQTKIMRHDFKEHLKVLEAYIGNDNKSAMDYLRSIELKNEEISITNYTGNKVLNVLFSEKQKLCISKGIVFKIHTTDIDLDFMKDIDIVSVFSNLLNNAVESGENSEGKTIYVNLYKMNGSFLVAKIENSCDSEPTMENGFFRTTKRSSGEHGIGLKSVAKTLKAYDGDLRMEYDSEERMFSATVMLPLNYPKIKK